MDGATRTTVALRDLAERIRAVEARGVGSDLGPVRTGWDAVDAALPGGGLRRGATHEFVSTTGPHAARSRSRDWEPSLAVVAFLAGAAGGVGGVGGVGAGWSVWVGRRVWPYGLALPGGTLGRMLCIDPPDAGARDWVVDAALRCAGLVVVADASGMDAAAARRVQLAAEAGGSVGLLARPWWEAKEVSFAWSRWLVAPATDADGKGGGNGGAGGMGGVGVVASRWVVTLDRCKGLQRCDSHRWTLERDTRGGVLTLASKMADGPRPAVGFYQPAQIVRDAQAHGVTVRPADVNHSDWDCTLEPTPDGHAIRLGLRLVKGVPQADAEKIVVARRAGGAFPDVLRLWRRSGASVRALNRLAEADAFGSMRLVRREALWAVQALKDDPLPLFAGCEPPAEVAPPLPVQTPYGLVSEDYRSVGFSLKAHPLSFVRDGLTARRVIRNADLADPARTPDHERVTVAGIVLVRQRPGTASGIVFFTIEDETGIANLIVRPRIYERFRRVARHSPVIAATGTVERAGKVVHVLVRSIREVEMAEAAAFERSRDFY